MNQTNRESIFCSSFQFILVLDLASSKDLYFELPLAAHIQWLPASLLRKPKPRTLLRSSLHVVVCQFETTKIRPFLCIKTMSQGRKHFGTWHLTEQFYLRRDVLSHFFNLIFILRSPKLYSAKKRNTPQNPATAQ